MHEQGYFEVGRNYQWTSGLFGPSGEVGGVKSRGSDIGKYRTLTFLKEVLYMPTDAALVKTVRCY